MSIYDTLNKEQKQAVMTTEGPLLLLAGAGSGKTRVITHRIAYLIDECNVNPWNILAITFTNKAAKEMRERIDHLIGFGSENIWVSTFHRLCVFILRKHINLLGYSSDFIIYDTDDQKSLMKDVLKYLNIDTKQLKERTILSEISHAKEKMISPVAYQKSAGSDFRKSKIAEAYVEYQKRLKKNNAVDFDDLLWLTVQLFQENPDVLLRYQNRFTYVMVDEYQDTNTVQFQLIHQIASHVEDGYTVHNLCVVGDDDQSIYKFRGANIYNILNFEQSYPDATVIKLEQNYRSTANILNAANQVISNNSQRKDKALWTNSEDGELIHVIECENEYDEAQMIAQTIKQAHENGQAYSDHAILYRTNAQSRALEESLVQYGLPYRIYGGINFYQRKEIKDLLAYLRTLYAGSDDLSVKRIINVPKRGIGLTSIDKLQTYASTHDLSFFDALGYADQIPGLNRASAKVLSFFRMMSVLRQKLETESLIDVYDELLEVIDFKEDIKATAENEEKAEDRLQNIDEFRNRLIKFEQESDTPATLGDFLEDIALVAEIDALDENADMVSLMTLHSAKGLEFPTVFLSGMEDGLFPSYMSTQSDDSSDLEEERRLCYVGITRAQKRLFMSNASTRMTHGETRYNRVSRFIQEIPRYLMEQSNSSASTPPEVRRKQSFGWDHNLDDFTSDYNSGFHQPSQAASFADAMNSLFAKPKKTTEKKEEVVFDSRTMDNKKDFLDKLFDKNPMVQKGMDTSTKFSAKPVKASTSKSLQSRPLSVGPARGTTTPFATLSYKEGDQVRHRKFGIGTVLKIERGSRDNVVTVEFSSGKKEKMLAGFADLKLVEGENE